jgi:hypothetical protein
MLVRVLELFSRRAWNVAFRTAHIAAMGVLLGGHAFDVQPERLVPSLWLSVATGVLLACSEAGPGWLWFHQLRGLMTLGKLVLVAVVPWFWPWRLPILLVVVVIASVGSHMPARFRYYSVLYREVIRGGCGPGTSQLAQDEGAEDRQP